ncbi:MAG: hypothetical protein U0457_20945 [Candidatus Sericytochromatia bacterium]
MGVIVQTLIKAFDYKESDNKNFNFKTELTRLLLNSGYSEYEVKKVFKFINFIMEIKNKELRSKFYGEVMEMSAIKDYKLELTDFEEVALEIRDKKIEKERDKKIAQKLFKLGVDKEKISNSTDLSIEEVEEVIKSIPQE